MRFAGLAVTDDGSLLAWVDGTERYATKVAIHAFGQFIVTHGQSGVFADGNPGSFNEYGA